MTDSFPGAPRGVALNILYVDDDADDRELFAEAMVRAQLPHKLTEVDSCEGAIKLLDAGNPYDIIFLDINLPAIDGRECLRMLKADASFRNIPVVMFTNSKSERDIDLAYNYGAHYHMIKPVAYINLIASLKLIFEIDWKAKQPIPPREKFVINYAFV
jgi:CheY-like chemotaxis protein